MKKQVLVSMFMSGLLLWSAYALAGGVAIPLFSGGSGSGGAFTADPLTTSVIKPPADSTTAIQVMKEDGVTPVVTVAVLKVFRELVYLARSLLKYC